MNTFTGTLFVMILVLLPAVFVEIKFRRNGNGKPDPEIVDMEDNICRKQAIQKAEFMQIRSKASKTDRHADLQKAL